MPSITGRARAVGQTGHGHRDASSARDTRALCDDNDAMSEPNTPGARRSRARARDAQHARSLLSQPVAHSWRRARGPEEPRARSTLGDEAVGGARGARAFRQRPKASLARGERRLSANDDPQTGAASR